MIDSELKGPTKLTGKSFTEIFNSNSSPYKILNMDIVLPGRDTRKKKMIVVDLIEE